MSGIAKVREPDHSEARRVFAALDTHMKSAYASIRDTPDYDPIAIEHDLQTACEQAGGVWIEMRFKPLVVSFETRQARYRLARKKNRYRCDVIGFSRMRKANT